MTPFEITDSGPDTRDYCDGSKCEHFSSHVSLITLLVLGCVIVGAVVVFGKTRQPDPVENISFQTETTFHPTFPKKNEDD